jgi:hypothetical protein
MWFISRCFGHDRRVKPVPRRRLIVGLPCAERLAHALSCDQWYRWFTATPQWQEFNVTLTVAHITPLISLLAGVLILIVPALLNYIVAIYMIVAGVIGLNEIHHFLNWLKAPAPSQVLWRPNAPGPARYD